jgi:hypothetical protein
MELVLVQQIVVIKVNLPITDNKNPILETEFAESLMHAVGQRSFILVIERVQIGSFVGA